LSGEIASSSVFGDHGFRSDQQACHGCGILKSVLTTFAGPMASVLQTYVWPD
jgi:hypothetical protein